MEATKPSSNVLLNRMWLDYCESNRSPDAFKRIVGDAIESQSRALADTRGAYLNQSARLLKAESSAHEPKSEHPPQLMAVVDKWQDNANTRRELALEADRLGRSHGSLHKSDAELIESVLRDIRRAVPPPGADALEHLQLAIVDLCRAMADGGSDDWFDSAKRAMDAVGKERFNAIAERTSNPYLAPTKGSNDA